MDLVKQFEILIELDDALKKVEAKIESVVQDSEKALAKQPNQRLAVVLVTCSAFTTDVNSILTLTQSMQSSRNNRAVTTLVESVTYIQQVTVWPVCTTSETSFLITVITVIQVQRTIIQTQMARINQLVSPQIQGTLSADVIPNVDIAPTPLHEPPHVGNAVLASNVAAGITIPTCSTDEDCTIAQAKDITTQTNLIYCVGNVCVECKIDTNCGENQSCIEGTCTSKTTATASTTTTTPTTTTTTTTEGTTKNPLTTNKTYTPTACNIQTLPQTR